MGPIAYRLGSWARGRWRTAAALAVVTAVAGGAALALVAGAVRTVTAPDRYSSWRGSRYDVNIQQSSGPPRTAELRALPGVARLNMASFVFGGLVPPDRDGPVDALVFAGSHEATGMRLAEGRVPDPARPGEFVASRHFLDRVGAHLGDRFRLVTLTQDEADRAGFDSPSQSGPSLTATLVGVVTGPSELEGDFPLALFPPTLLDQGDVGVAASVGVAALAPGATAEGLRAQLDGLPDGNLFSLDAAEWVSADVRAAVNAQGQGLLVLGAIVSVATIVVLGQLLTRQLRLEDHEPAALEALGFTHGQVLAEPLCRVAGTVAAGAAGAAGFGYLASASFPIGFVRVVEPHPGRAFDPAVLVPGPVVLVAALVGWAFVTLATERRGHPAFRPSTMTERVAAALPGVRAGTAVRFAFTRPASRARPARTPLAGLLLVFCVLFGALTFGANLDRLVTEPKTYGVNFDLALGTGATEIATDIRDALEHSADVGALMLYGTTAVAVGAGSLDVVGMEPVRGDLLPEAMSGRLPQGDAEILLGKGAARRLRVGVGDTLTVSGATGARSLQVVGLGLVPSVGGADGVGESGLVTRDGFRALDPEAAMSIAAVKLADDAPSGAIARIAAATRSSAGQVDPPPAIVNLGRVRSIPLLVAAAVGSLATLSLGHLMLVSVRRRRLDHAILRAIGATHRWITGVVHWQATLTTAAAVLLAVPLGTAMGVSLYRQVADHAGAGTDAIVPLAWLGGTLAGLFAVANAVAAIPAWRARRATTVRLLTRD